MDSSPEGPFKPYAEKTLTKLKKLDSKLWKSIAKLRDENLGLIWLPYLFGYKTQIFFLFKTTTKI